MNLNTLLLVAEAINTLAEQLNLSTTDILNALEDKNLITLREYMQLQQHYYE